MDPQPEKATQRQLTWYSDLTQHRQDIRDILDGIQYERCSCLELVRKRESSHLLRSICGSVRRSLLALNDYTMNDENGDSTLPLPWLYRVCLPSVKVANPPDSSVECEHLKRGYYFVLTQTLLSLCVLEDLYTDLYVMTCSHESCLRAPEYQWGLLCLRVVSSQQ